MHFCPTCGNLLLISSRGGDSGRFRFTCNTCPYIHNIVNPVVKRSILHRKEVDDVLGGAEAWANVDQTAIDCAKCTSKQAFFMQIQTRSADEPMTTFYKCANFQCGHQWKEG